MYSNRYLNETASIGNFMKIFHYLIAILLLIGTSTANAESLRQKNNSSSDLSQRSNQIDTSKLTPEEIEIYKQGEISTGQLVGGGLLGTFVGFGLGHVAYEKYSSKGWIFTVGELGSYALMASGAVSFVTSPFSSNGLGVYTFGAIAFIGFKIWEIVDVWTTPQFHNNRYHSIKERLDGSQNIASYHLSPLIVQSQNEKSTSNIGYGGVLT